MSGLVDPEIMLVSKGKINHFVTAFLKDQTAISTGDDTGKEGCLW